MAQVQTPFLCFLLLLILSSTSPVLAIRHQKLNSETSSVFSLPLHRHDSIVNQQNLNYTSQAIAQLESDIARVRHINSRLTNNLPNFQQEDIQAPLTSISGGYAARVGVGQPVKEFYLLADTGSHINWLQCNPCPQQKCYPQIDPIFEPSQSSTYQPLPCSSQQCNALMENGACASGTCNYKVSYGGGALASKSTGEFATETLSFGSSGSVNNVAIGCGHDNEGNLRDFAGIFGLGVSDIAFPSQIKAKSFSYCLVGADSKSSSTLDFNSAPPADSITVPFRTNPVLKGAVYYYVELTGITVGENQIQFPSSVYQIGSDGKGGIIVDSGTTLTSLDSQVYQSVRDAFRSNTQNLVQGSFGGFETCYDVPSGSASSFPGPSMSFQFSNGQSTPPLGPENYLFRVDNSTFCLAFVPTDQPVSIIGNIQQIGMRITYDLEKSVIGFSPKKC